MNSRVGRIALDRIFKEWSENQPLNPRLLALEVADAIRSISHEEMFIPIECASVIGVAGTHSESRQITMWAVAGYLESIGTGKIPKTIASARGPVRSGTVLLARYWIDQLVKEATERAAISTGLAQVAKLNNNALTTTEPLSGSDPACLAVRQEQLRQAAEKAQHEQLEQERAARQALDQELACLRAEKDMLASRSKYYQECAELSHRAENEERRARFLAEEQLKEERLARRSADKKAEEAEKLAKKAASDHIKNLPKQLSELAPGLTALSEMAKLFSSDTSSKPSRSTSDRGLFLVIAGLLELLLDRNRPSYNQGSAAGAIADKGWHGVGERQINGVFSTAKKEAAKARKDATEKAINVKNSNNSPPKSH